VKLRLEDPFSGMVAAPNALIIAGAEMTVTLAFEVLPVPPLVDVTVTLLFFTPAVVPVTFNEIVQLAPGTRLVPLTLAEDEPLTAAAVPEQVEFRFVGVATTMPSGRLSVNAMPVRVEFALGFVRVNVRLVEAFSGIVAAPKTFAIAGGAMTVRLAEEVD
jgi:hypothetical protein